MKTTKDKVLSVMESLLFMSPDPRPLSDFEKLFEGEIPPQQLKQLLNELKDSYSKKERGICLEEVRQGWQLRTKTENRDYLLKTQPKNLFRLSRPSLEVLSIIAFEQPCTKMEIDEIRGVDSGHLLRTLMEKGLIHPAGKSDLPGRASFYKTSGRFLEVFGLNSLEDLPSEEELEELFTEKQQQEEKTLQSASQELNQSRISIPYQEDERENKKIRDSLKSLPSTVEFLKKEQIKNLKTTTKETKELGNKEKNPAESKGIGQGKGSAEMIEKEPSENSAEGPETGGE